MGLVLKKFIFNFKKSRNSTSVLYTYVLFKKKNESRLLQNKLLMMNNNKQNPMNGSQTSHAKLYLRHKLKLKYNAV